METQYQTISKFDLTNGGLQGGNNLQTKPTTIETVNKITGEAETYIVQTIRTEDGDHIVIKYLDKDGPIRIVLPPKVSTAIHRHNRALTDRSRSNAAKAKAQERKLRGELPGFMKKG